MRTRIALLIVFAACTQAPTTTPSSSPSPTPSPSSPKPFVFAVIGDWGAGTDAQARIAGQVCRQHSRIGLVDVVTVGDNFYNPDGRATQSNFYRPMKCLLPWVRWHATWGNHDQGGTSTGTVLGAKRRYTWRAGGAEFFMLDSNAVTSRAQQQWLESALRASKARFKIAVFHHPGRSVGGVHQPDANVRARWIPLFERYHVTLVLNGHEHDYEHHLANGVHYVISGGGGAIAYGCEREDPALVRCESTHEYLLVSIGATEITVTAILPSGRTLDSFEIAANTASR